MLPKDFDHSFAQFRLVTPTFLGGFDHRAEQLRASALKGALRFWWRVLAYADLAPLIPDDVNLLRALQAQEHRLFGSASVSGNESTGQSRVRLRLRWSTKTPLSKPHASGHPLLPPRERPGAVYLGYGVVDINGQLTRSGWPSGREFDVHLMLRSTGDERQDQRLRRAFRLLGLLGGIGARARRGYGSLAMMACSDADGQTQLPTDERDYANRLRMLLDPSGVIEREPPFSALTARSRLETVLRGSDPLAVLDHIGRQMQRFRSWGHQGQVNNQDSERNFENDHQWFYDALAGDLKKTAPQRSAFGLPHAYHKRGAGGASVEPADPNFGRRASPLLIHIHPTQQDGYIGVLCRLDGVFLPGDAKLSLSSKGRGATADMDPDWRATLEKFFDGPPKRDAGLPPYFRPVRDRYRILPRQGEPS